MSGAACQSQRARATLLAAATVSVTQSLMDEEAGAARLGLVLRAGDEGQKHGREVIVRKLCTTCSTLRCLLVLCTYRQKQYGWVLFWTVEMASSFF